MRDADFEWADAKAANNVRRHGVTFEMAREAFDDAWGIEWPDDSQNDAEARFSLLGIVADRLLFVGFTEREGRTRIITARLAVARERQKYDRENQT